MKTLTKTLIVCIMCFVMVSVFSSVIFASAVTFPDSNLEQALRANRNIPNEGPITTQHLESLRTLTLRNANITNLAGLERAVNLTTLNVQNNNISIFPISMQNLKLTALNLSGNNLSQITNVTRIKTLRTLDLSNNSLRSTHLSTLKTLDNLTRLNIRDNPGLDYLSTTNPVLEFIKKLQNKNVRVEFDPLYDVELIPSTNYIYRLENGRAQPFDVALYVTNLLPLIDVSAARIVLDVTSNVEISKISFADGAITANSKVLLKNIELGEDRNGDFNGHIIIEIARNDSSVDFPAEGYLTDDPIAVFTIQPTDNLRGTRLNLNVRESDIRDSQNVSYSGNNSSTIINIFESYGYFTNARRIGFDDIVLFALAFGKQSSDPGWIEEVGSASPFVRFDIVSQDDPTAIKEVNDEFIVTVNPDGKITIKDFIVFMRVYQYANNEGKPVRFVANPGTISPPETPDPVQL